MPFFALALVALSTFASLSYKLCTNRKFHPARRRAILSAHAFFIEAIQLVLLVTWVVMTAFIAGIAPRTPLPVACRTAPPCLAIFTTTTIYASAMLATDIMDNLIQLHTWRHPIQSQTLILTRNILIPHTVLRKVKRSLKKTAIVRRGRAMSEPTTPTFLQPVLQPTLHDLRRQKSAPRPGSVAKLVSTFEEVLSCTVALSRLEQQTKGAVYELEGKSLPGSIEEPTNTLELTSEATTAVLIDEPASEEALQESPSMEQNTEPRHHKKAARHTQARVEARRRKAQELSA